MVHITCVRNRGYFTEIQRNTKEKSVKFVQLCRRHTLLKELDKENPFDGKDLNTEHKERLVDAFTKYERKLNISVPLLLLVYNYWRNKRKFHQEPLLRRFQVIITIPSSHKFYFRIW
jgi:hypothetical protein